MALSFLDLAHITELPLDSQTLAAIQHYQKVISKKEFFPLLKPGTNEIGIAELPIRTTEAIEAIAEEIRAILIYQSVTASNPCSCAALFQAYEALKARIIAETKKADVREQELARIDAEMRRKWGDGIPLQFATTITDPPCPFCRRPRPVPNLLAFSTPSLRQKVLTLLFGGHVPLQFLLLALSELDTLIFNEEVIPESKKKQVTRFLDKTGIKLRLEGVYQWLRGETTPSASPSVSMPTDSAINTGTTATIGDSPRPTWTPDLAPDSAPSTLNTGNGGAN